ncbi:MAG: hypothetical protein RLZZ126_27 [Pseudomonadota bacterium]|jgi:uncharacterized protein YndB with AHSA1/START domain
MKNNAFDLSLLPRAEVSQDAPFVIEHVFQAPLDRVWQVYTQPEHLSQWMRPAGLTDAGCTVDLRPGGVFHYGMGTPDGQIMWGKWTYLEITSPEHAVARMKVIVSFSDKDQGVTRHPMSPTWPLETLSEMTLTAEGNTTRLRLAWRACNANEVEQTTFNSSHASMTQGWRGTLQGLEAYLAQQQRPSQAPVRPDEFFITRLLHGSPQQVFDAFTQPELLAQWWGPWLFDRAETSIDLRVGGKHAIAMTAPDGSRYSLCGEYLDIQAPHKLVMTMDASAHPAAWHDLVDPARGDNPNPAGVSVQTVWIEPEGEGRTRLTVRTRFERALIRDNMLKLGMPDGWAESLEKLDELVQGILPRALHVSRLYPHPLERVYAAFTTAEALAQWWGPNGFSITTQHFDFRVGGVWQFVMHGPDGKDWPNKIVFTQIEPQRLMAHAHGDFSMGDDGSGAFFHASIRFGLFAGMTRVTNHLLFATAEARDATAKMANAVEGGKQTLARLEAYLQGQPTP